MADALTTDPTYQPRARNGQETVGANHQGITLDQEFSNNELEYYTRENVSIVLHGLLVNLQFNSPPPAAAIGR